MARNVEIKARLPGSIESLLPRARALADGPGALIEPDDTFFNGAHGRLKLRDFCNGTGQLGIARDQRVAGTHLDRSAL